MNFRYTQGNKYIERRDKYGIKRKIESSKLIQTHRVKVYIKYRQIQSKNNSKEKIYEKKNILSKDIYRK